jgi:DNA-binding helix-hairpin-helix protein with protein kinase domain
MLYQVEFNSMIAKNVMNAFKEIHAKGVCHGDVRVENILVKEDNSVVLIDFESSEMNADKDLLNEEMGQVKSLLAELKKRVLNYF